MPFIMQSACVLYSKSPTAYIVHTVDFDPANTTGEFHKLEEACVTTVDMQEINSVSIITIVSITIIASITSSSASGSSSASS